MSEKDSSERDAPNGAPPAAGQAERAESAPPLRVREMEIDNLAAVFHLGGELFRPTNVLSL